MGEKIKEEKNKEANKTMTFSKKDFAKVCEEMPKKNIVTNSMESTIEKIGYREVERKKKKHRKKHYLVRLLGVATAVIAFVLFLFFLFYI